MSSTAHEPARRIVLLGASNLTRGLATALATLQHGERGPIDLLAAPGNGRSYGLYSRVLLRGLPGILQCGLWRHLTDRQPLPTAALLTDIGNDVMYGVEVPQILAWVEECLRRLQDYGAHTVVTGLPVNNFPRLRAWRYHLLRTLFFPRNHDDLATTVRRSYAVDEGVRNLAERYAAQFIAPAESWYGFDPIHYRYAHWPTAWKTFADSLRKPSGDMDASADDRRPPPRVSLWNTLGAQCWVPEERRLAGLVQHRIQPSVVLADGTQISIF